ncbi:MAG: Vitamin K epoxide reductase [Parcubacteria group bacterium Gr01-1014_13]|nr:MAG: Vitamin K epoxide reductase [Parcubacteria group bacterium Gr01-1014_13]
MPNSETSSNKLVALSNWLPISFLILSAIGFIDATYLTTQHFLGTPIACSILKGCEEVTTSRYSTIGPVPISLLGSLYYLTVLILGVIYLDTKKIKALNLLAKITPLGFLASAYLVYLQIFVIKAICLYCMGSAVTSTLLFVLSLIFWQKQKNSARNKQSSSL